MTSTTANTVKRMLRTRGALVAAVTAGAVGLTLVVQELAQLVIGQIAVAASGQDLGAAGFTWGFLGLAFLTTTLPFTIGFFLSLWFVAPISEKLGLGHVITRSVLATGIAATLWFVVRSVVQTVLAIGFDRPIFSNSFPQLQFTGPDLVSILGWSLQGALLAFVTILPLGVLAGILLWLWRKANPPKFHVEGLIDV